MKKLALSRAEFPKILILALLGFGLLFSGWGLKPVAWDFSTAASHRLRITSFQNAEPGKTSISFLATPASFHIPNVPLKEIDERCWGTKGTWCKDWLQQTFIPWNAPPRGNKPCLWDCNNVGVCDAIKGWCRCSAGWTGDACDQRQRRPCSQLYRTSGFTPYEGPTNWNYSGLTLRCAGACDDDIGMCYCNSESKYGRIPPDKHSPPNTPPVQVGRPLGHYCQPNKIPGTDRKTDFGDVDPDLLFGDDGWCEAKQANFTCVCHLDGMLGPYCDIRAEHFCPNQCSGHGECYLGWCHCQDGYFGQDCAYRMPGVNWTLGLLADRPWLQDYIRTFSSQDPPPGSIRRRPLIYVYELDPMYNQRMLQYRIFKGSCTHRLFQEENVTEFRDDWFYQAESGIHEMMLQSRHRTLNPEEADFFYMPVYISCYFFPVFGAADFPNFHGGPAGGTRPSEGTNMMLEAWSWLKSRYPYWDRNGGKDHILVSIWIIPSRELSI